MVSYRDEDHWISRSYDSAALPNAMREIYDVVGERSETKKPVHHEP